MGNQNSKMLKYLAALCFLAYCYSAPVSTISDNNVVFFKFVTKRADLQDTTAADVREKRGATDCVCDGKRGNHAKPCTQKAAKHTKCKVDKRHHCKGHAPASKRQNCN